MTSPHRLKKLKKKAVRKAQTENEIERDPSRPSPWQLRKFFSSKKNVKRSEQKIASKKCAKRTDPKSVTFKTEPASPHQEGKRWIKTVRNQSLQRAKKLSRKLFKRK